MDVGEHRNLNVGDGVWRGEHSLWRACVGVGVVEEGGSIHGEMETGNKKEQGERLASRKSNVVRSFASFQSPTKLCLPDLVNSRSHAPFSTWLPNFVTLPPGSLSPGCVG